MSGGRYRLYQALYRKWRPKDFDSVCGQEHITSVLKYEIIHDRCSHAYLFCGSRGTGKTSCAKLLAKAVNCLSPVNGSPCGVCDACRAIEEERTADVVEMDAASNTGVDYIREIREAVMYAPSMLKNRVYIIDEVHMLTQSAFNALLKTLEEPPERVFFILATTEPQKIPATILSRCQKFEFRRIPSEIIADRLLYISEKEGINTEPAAAKIIAKMAQGGMRDALSLFELCAGEGKNITAETVKAITGAIGREQAAEVAEAVLKKDVDALFSVVSEAVASSKELTVFWQELMDFYRDMLIFRAAGHPERYLDLTEDELKQIKSLSEKFSGAVLLRHCSLLEEAYSAMQRPGASKRLCAEMTFLKMCDETLDCAPAGLAARVSALEERLAAVYAGRVTPVAGTGSPQKLNFVSGEQTVMYKKSVIPESAVTADSRDKPGKDFNALDMSNTINALNTSDTPNVSGSLGTLNKNGGPAVRQGPKPVSWWAEATKKVSETNPSVSPFMKLSRAFENGDRILVRVSGSIARDMLDNARMRQLLSELSLSFSGRLCPADKFDFIETGIPTNEKNPIDDLSDV